MAGQAALGRNALPQTWGSAAAKRVYSQVDAQLGPVAAMSAGTAAIYTRLNALRTDLEEGTSSSDDSDEEGGSGGGRI